MEYLSKCGSELFTYKSVNDGHQHQQKQNKKNETRLTVDGVASLAV